MKVIIDIILALILIAIIIRMFKASNKEKYTDDFRDIKGEQE